jgi:glucosamine-6-phosphate deaminase
MQIHIYDNVTQVGQAAATLFTAQLLRKPDSVFGFATGSSPSVLYRQLIALRRAGILDFSSSVSFSLDEYCGIPISHPCSYRAFMQAELFDHINMKATYVPDGNAPDLAAECVRYDAQIAACGGIDMQLLGIGRNGHIAFNEPSGAFSYETHVTELTPSTIDANKRFFQGEEVPRKAISMGIGSIMASRELVMIATGSDKAQAVRYALEGDIDPMFPASIIRFHKVSTLFLDKAAAALL